MRTFVVFLTLAVAGFAADVMTELQKEKLKRILAEANVAAQAKTNGQAVVAKAEADTKKLQAEYNEVTKEICSVAKLDQKECDINLDTGEITKKKVEAPKPVAAKPAAAKEEAKK